MLVYEKQRAVEAADPPPKPFVRGGEPAFLPVACPTGTAKHDDGQRVTVRDHLDGGLNHLYVLSVQKRDDGNKRRGQSIRRRRRRRRRRRKRKRKRAATIPVGTARISAA